MNRRDIDFMKSLCEEVTMTDTTDSATKVYKIHKTQWTAQFLVAAKLTRLGYTVAFTMGNQTPIADLMVGKPNGELFWVDVKGLSSKTAWLVHPKEPCADLFYVLVYLDEDDKSDRFFVLTQEEAGKLVKDYADNHPNDKGIIKGFGFKDPGDSENAWQKLPSTKLKSAISGV
jgi:hypothetical protein